MTYVNFPVENVTYDGQSARVSVDTEWGACSICGYMDTFEAGSPIWGVFRGMMDFLSIRIPVTLHFTANFGTLIINIPDFIPELYIPKPEMCTGTLDGEPVALSRIPGAPWLKRNSLIVAERHAQIVVAFVR